LQQREHARRTFSRASEAQPHDVWTATSDREELVEITDKFLKRLSAERCPAIVERERRRLSNPNGAMKNHV
jgi:predicted RNA-binding protein with PIN domain